MRAIIIDDENHGLDHLQAVLAIVEPELNVVGKFRQPVEAIPAILQEEPDLVIMDLEMPYITGLEMARLFSYSNAHFIIVSTHEIDELPFELDRTRTSILLKPFSSADLKNILKGLIIKH